MATPTNLPGSFTAGNVLTAAQMNDVRGAFRILQIVADSTTSAQTVSSGTYADTDLSIAITPQATSNKILAVFTGISYSDATGTEGSFRIMRGSTSIAEINGLGYNSAGNAIGSPLIVCLDSPSTTSSTTYKVQFKRFGGAGTIYLSPNSSYSSLTLLEVSA